MARRLNFLHYILQQESHTLLAKFFNAQKCNPIKNDWVLSIYDDLSQLNIEKSLEDIKVMKKEAFKNFIKEKIKKTALEYLTNIKGKHSKMDNLNYEKLDLQTYLKSNFFKTEVQQLFKFRTRMANVKTNFKNGNEDDICPFQSCDKIDDQEHLLSCVAIHGTTPSKEKYSDIFSNIPNNARKAIQELMSSMEKRENLLSK